MLPYTAIDGLAAMRAAYDLPLGPTGIGGVGRRWTRQRVRTVLVAFVPWVAAMSGGGG